MTFNKIRRGPMGGDQYTRIHNLVFRDKERLLPVDMAIFGYISTHEQGWQTSAAGIAREMGIPETTVGKSLRRLKRHHYLIYGQDRRDDGTVDTGWYFITDLPAQLRAMKITDEAVVAKQVEEALADWLVEQNGGEAPVPPLTNHGRRPSTPAADEGDGGVT